jgi:hypothetical protein
MEWQEKPNDSTMLEFLFTHLEAEALSSACVERTQLRASLGNSSLNFDQSIIEIFAEQKDNHNVCIYIDDQNFHHLPALMREFADRTLDVAPDGGIMSDEEKCRSLRRRKLGGAAANLCIELEGAVAAYETGFHQKLAAFLQDK